jgi:hypothetical protein
MPFDRLRNVNDTVFISERICVNDMAHWLSSCTPFDRQEFVFLSPKLRNVSTTPTVLMARRIGCIRVSGVFTYRPSHPVVNI